MNHAAMEREIRTDPKLFAEAICEAVDGDPDVATVFGEALMRLLEYGDDRRMRLLIDSAVSEYAKTFPDRAGKQA